MIGVFKGRSVCPAGLDSPFLRKQKFLNAWWRRVLGLASAGGGARIFWEDRCESYPNDWVEVSVHMGSFGLSDVDPVEGSHCFRYYDPVILSSGHLDKVIAAISLPNPFNFWVWLNVDTFAVGDEFLVNIELTTGWVGVRLTHGTATHVSLQACVHSGSYGDVVTMSFPGWHEIRCLIEQVGANVHNSLYVDGVLLTMYSRAEVVGDLNGCHLDFDGGGSKIYQDHFRVTA